jgi:hypothetical protein
MKDDGCWYWPYFRTLKKGNMQREMIITQDYLSANQEIVELRLKQAGVRLGALLNATWRASQRDVGRPVTIDSVTRRVRRRWEGQGIRTIPN